MPSIMNARMICLAGKLNRPVTIGGAYNTLMYSNLFSSLGLNTLCASSFDIP